MEKKRGKLIIARHHESIWNKTGHWTGNRDVSLTDLGRQESFKMGQAIAGERIDMAISSELIRAIETLEIMVEAMGQAEVLREKSAALNERDYGDYTGKDKWEMKTLFGEEKFDCVRRGWDCPVPNGETLKMVSARVVPYYLNRILPELLTGKNVLIVAHTNSLRALIKYIEKISDQAVENLELPFGKIILYDVDDEGLMIDKQEIFV